jgi:crotonobetainyl-CoA:carnitine CoA-transferase CaiB-like acyl-CoA transferase
MAGPLHGLKVLDFTSLWPGPLATLWLADLGAEVLRVEAPDRPDLLRWLPPLDPRGEGAAWSMANRNKRSMVLNLKAPGAADVVKRLVKSYDVVVEQFRPGVLDKLGVGYEALRQVQPGLIWCAITGFGQTGPLRDRPGHDIDFVALSGIASHMGRPGQGPSQPGVLVADVGGGTYPALVGVLAAVVQRLQTGQGALVDVSMLDGALWFDAMAASGVLAGGPEARPGEDALAGGSAYDYFPTRDGGWLAVGALEPKFWTMFCRAIERPDLEHHPAERPSDRWALRQELARTLASRDRVDWMGVFAQVPCCVEPVLTTLEALNQPQVLERGMVVDVPLPEGGSVRQLATPVRFAEGPPTRAAVLPGHDTQAVLNELGLTPAEQAELRTAGVLG